MKSKLKEQFLTDAKGHKRAVVIDLESYQELLEDIADLKAVAERKNGPKYSSAQFVLKLKKHGIL